MKLPGKHFLAWCIWLAAIVTLPECKAHSNASRMLNGQWVWIRSENVIPENVLWLPFDTGPKYTLTPALPSHDPWDQIEVHPPSGRDQPDHPASSTSKSTSSMLGLLYPIAVLQHLLNRSLSPLEHEGTILNYFTASSLIDVSSVDLANLLLKPWELVAITTFCVAINSICQLYMHQEIVPFVCPELIANQFIWVTQ